MHLHSSCVKIVWERRKSVDYIFFHSLFFFFNPLQKKEEPGSSVRIAVDSKGDAVYQGEIKVNFRVLIPRNAWENGEPASVLQYGHGEFSSFSLVKVKLYRQQYYRNLVFSHIS